MRLCSNSDDARSYYVEKSAGNRIHTEGTRKEFVHHDRMDLAGMLQSTAQDAKGILVTVESGKILDINGKEIDIATVRNELSILSVDLAKIAQVVKKFIDSEELKENSADFNPLMHNMEKFSIPEGVKKLDEMANIFKELSAKIGDKKMV
jgi:hypothetical protein